MMITSEKQSHHHLFPCCQKSQDFRDFRWETVSNRRGMRQETEILPTNRWSCLNPFFPNPNWLVRRAMREGGKDKECKIQIKGRGRGTRVDQHLVFLKESSWPSLGRDGQKQVGRTENHQGKGRNDSFKSTRDLIFSLPVWEMRADYQTLIGDADEANGDVSIFTKWWTHQTGRQKTEENNVMMKTIKNLYSGMKRPNQGHEKRTKYKWWSSLNTIGWESDN